VLRPSICAAPLQNLLLPGSGTATQKRRARLNRRARGACAPRPPAGGGAGYSGTAVSSVTARRAAPSTRARWRAAPASHPAPDLPPLQAGIGPTRCLLGPIPGACATARPSAWPDSRAAEPAPARRRRGAAQRQPVPPHPSPAAAPGLGARDPTLTGRTVSVRGRRRAGRPRQAQRDPPLGAGQHARGRGLQRIAGGRVRRLRRRRARAGPAQRHSA